VRRGRRDGLADRADLVAQVEHDPAGRLLADAGDERERIGVTGRDRALQALRPVEREHRERDLRTDARHRHERAEQLASVLVQEAVHADLFVPDLHDGVDGHLAACLREVGDRHLDAHADAADLDDRCIVGHAVDSPTDELKHRTPPS
jgi:hypothetical protein